MNEDEALISEHEQIVGLLTGTFHELLRRRIANPPTDLRRFITIDRAQIVQFLKEHFDYAEAYFCRQETSTTTHDVLRMFRKGKTFVVVSMDHGKWRDCRAFPTLNEAVADHIVLSYGMG